MKKTREMGLGVYGKHNCIGLSLYCLTIFAVIFLTACSTGISDNGDVSSESNSIVQKPEWVYVPERIEVADKRVDYDNMKLIGDIACYISMNGESEDGAQSICQYSLTDRELASIPIDWKDDGYLREICCYSFDEDFNVCLIANVYSSGFGKLRRFLYKFDPEGKNLFFKDITEWLGSGISMSGMTIDRQGRMYIFTDEYSEKTGIWLFTADGNYHGTISYGSSENVLVRGAVDGDDGKFYVCISKGEEGDHCALAEVDFENRQFAEFLSDFPAVNGICADPTGQYDLLLYDDIAAYGYYLPSQKKEELFAWGSSDVNGYYVKTLSLLEDGRYFCTVGDWTNDDRSLVLLTETRSEEVPDRLDLVLAAVDGGSELTALAVGFNRINDQYHITIKNYGSITDLYNAILAKETIDIIDLSGVNVESLCRQGIFQDLSTYLEQSETITRSDFLDGILEAYTFDGTLVGIPEGFWLRTVAGDGSLMGNDTGLTLEGLFVITESNSQAMPFDEITKEEMMQFLMMFNEDAFIDWETGECHFNSAQFKAVLEFVNRFPDSIGSGQGDVSLPNKIQNGDVLFAIADISAVKNFQLYEEIFGENAAYVGFPAMDGKRGTLLFAYNAFGIVASSENKGGAWNFIESVLTRKDTGAMDKEEVYQYYTYGLEPAQLPTMKNVMSAIIDYIMETDKKEKFGARIYDDG